MSQRAVVPDRGDLDLVCASYVAATRVLRLARFPSWDTGSEIVSEDTSFAGDGPLVAGFAAGLGLSVGLAANGVAADDAGREVLAFLERRAIVSDVRVSARRTPTALILTHPDAGREWLVDLQDAATDLAASSGELIRRGRVVYVDCFASIEAGARRVLELADEAGAAIHANIGAARDLPEALAQTLARVRIDTVQASLPEEERSRAITVAGEIAERFGAHTVYVTLGAGGAVGLVDGVAERAAARAVDVDYTHGAGAAFSAGAIYGSVQGWPPERLLEFACSLGSMQCTAFRREAPSEADVDAFAVATAAGPLPGADDDAVAQAP